MDLEQYWKGMSRKQKECFASDIGCSTSVITTAYIYPDDETRKCPSNKRLARMVVASKGKLSIRGLLEFFKGRAVRLELLKLQKKESPVTGA